MNTRQVPTCAFWHLESQAAEVPFNNLWLHAFFDADAIRSAPFKSRVSIKSFHTSPQRPRYTGLPEKGCRGRASSRAQSILIGSHRDLTHR
jgi:hypothetical protein